MKSGKGFLLLDALISMTLLFLGSLVCLQAFSLAVLAVKAARLDSDTRLHLQKEFLHEQGFNPD